MILLKRNDYVYAAAYVRALENRFLNNNDIEALITADSYLDAVRLLKENGFFSEEIPFLKIDEALLKKQEKYLNEAIWASPEKDMLNIFLYKNDFHNLKAVLKAAACGIKKYERFLLFPADIAWGLFVEAAEKADFSVLPKDMRKTAEEAYNALNILHEPSLCEAITDKACMDKMMKKARENTFMQELIRLENTMADIKTAYRCGKAGNDKAFLEKSLSEEPAVNRSELIEAAMEKNVPEFLKKNGITEAEEALKKGSSYFEQYANKKIYEYIRRYGNVSFGIEAVIAYIYRGRAETDIIRIILNAKYNKISAEEIRSSIKGLAEAVR